MAHSAILRWFAEQTTTIGLVTQSGRLLNNPQLYPTLVFGVSLMSLYRCLTRQMHSRIAVLLFAAFSSALMNHSAFAIDDAKKPAAMIDGIGPDWRALGQDDFVNVNCDENTWSFPNGEIHCTGSPVGVMRTKKELTNFELVVEWRHLKAAGNSGVFLWATEQSLSSLKRNGLPAGIEVQVLDHGYTEAYKKQTGKDPDWFTTNGDVFPTGNATMKPFAPVAPDGHRSFPRKNLSRGVGEWNHYYVRAINGEVRLWVNGEEVSGGTECKPAKGFLCLESEGSPIEFRGLRLRELP